jgi:hypothetical protein
MRIKNRELNFTFLFFILLSIVSIRIPFFWDGTFFSQLAIHFYEKGFSSLIAPSNVDTGGFPMYSVYLAVAWKVFGKSLWVSHLVMLPFLLGITYEYFKLAKRFLAPKTIPFAMLLLVSEPTFITQSVLMGYDIMMIYFFFLALNTMLQGRKYIYQIALTMLLLSNVRGSILFISLFLLENILTYLQNKKIKIEFKSYILPAAIIILWMIYHQMNTGWYLFSPERQNTHESVVPAASMLKQLFFITWKISDFGRIALWLFILTGSIILYRIKRFSEIKNLVLIILIPLVTLVICMVPFANPIGHKYFIVIFLSLNIGVCFIIQQIKKERIQYASLIVLSIILITGNFWIYPERYGNGWDSSLKVISYFKIKQKMDEYIKAEKIDAIKVGSQFPLITEEKFSNLSDSDLHYSNVWSGPVTMYKYFLQTNVINTDIPDEIDFVKKNWHLVKEFKAGEVYIALYKI